MSEKLYCTNCGAALVDGAVFCHKCGTKVLSVPDIETLDAAEQVEDHDISMTTVIREMEALVNEPSAASNRRSQVEKPSAVTDIPLYDHKEPEIARTGPLGKKSPDDPWPWEIPAFTNTEENLVQKTQEAEEEIKAEPVKEVQETKEPPVIPITPKKPVFKDTEDTGTNRKITRKEFDDDEDFEDEYETGRKWPFVLLALIIILALCGLLLYFFRPTALNRGIDMFNSLAHTGIPHVGERAAATPTPTPEATPTPETTPEPTAEPEPEPVEVTETESPDNYLETVTTYFVVEYKAYLNAMNNNTLESLDHITEDVRSALIDRYESVNKNYTFYNQQLFLDSSTYKVYQGAEEGTYDIAFLTQAFNECYDSNGALVDNTPVLDVVIHYNPSTDDWTVTKMQVNNSLNIDANSFVQIVE